MLQSTTAIPLSYLTRIHGEVTASLHGTIFANNISITFDIVILCRDQIENEHCRRGSKRSK